MTAMTPIRRVVTGEDDAGRSCVVWDGPAPQVHGSAIRDRGHTDLWVWRTTPAPLAGTQDDGLLPDEFPGPVDGGHLRVVHWRELGDDPTTHVAVQPHHAPELRPSGRTWDRGGGNNVYRSAMHKTESVDYGILLSGERNVILDDTERVLKPGDVIVQVGAWHEWDSARCGCLMVFDMMSAHFVDGPAGLAQSDAPVLQPDPRRVLPPGVRPARRVVTIDREPGRSTLVSDGPTPDVRLDPARPGYALSRLWVTAGTPAPIVPETLHLPHVLLPPPRGSVCRMETLPPDRDWHGRVDANEARRFYAALGAPNAGTAHARSPHPYMRRTPTLEFCCVIEGEATLLLDTAEVTLHAGDIAIVRGNTHAWSNRRNEPCLIAVAAHDGTR